MNRYIIFFMFWPAQTLANGFVLSPEILELRFAHAVTQSADLIFEEDIFDKQPIQTGRITIRATTATISYGLGYYGEVHGAITHIKTKGNGGLIGDDSGVAQTQFGYRQQLYYDGIYGVTGGLTYIGPAGDYQAGTTDRKVTRLPEYVIHVGSGGYWDSHQTSFNVELRRALRAHQADQWRYLFSAAHWGLQPLTVQLYFGGMRSDSPSLDIESPEYIEAYISGDPFPSVHENYDYAGLGLSLTIDTISGTLSYLKKLDKNADNTQLFSSMQIELSYRF